VTSGGSDEGRLIVMPLRDRTDAELVHLAQADLRAFGPLYDRYVGAVYGFCYRRLGSKEAAEDATVQAFTRALAAIPRYREGGTFAAWLFTTAANVVVDTQRKRHDDHPLDGVAEPHDPAASPEDQAIAADERATVRALLGDLPDDQRRAIELRLAGLSGPEAAEVMGRSNRAVKMLQFRAITQLRTLLGVESSDQDHAQREGPDAQD